MTIQYKQKVHLVFKNRRLVPSAAFLTKRALKLWRRGNLTAQNFSKLVYDRLWAIIIEIKQFSTCCDHLRPLQ
jgi:2-hydroxychromene-2-carboxylate isomerase